MLLLACGSCKGGTSRREGLRIHLNLWHTFNPDETMVLNRVLAAAREAHPRWAVRSTVLPFAHAQSAFRRAVKRCGVDAPDVLRAELPWIAGLVERGALRPVPAGVLAERDYLPAARKAARYHGKRWVLPASVDGLVLLYNKQLLKRPPKTLDALLREGKRLTVDSKGKSAADVGFDQTSVKRWGFYVRGDGYWFLPFLWAFGGELLDPSSKTIFIADARAQQALSYYKDLAAKHHIAPAHVRLSNDYEDQLQRFGRGALAMMVNGPWASSAVLKLPAFSTPANLGVAPLPRGPSGRPTAPLSGHGYVVTRCSKHPDAAWKLVQALAGVQAQARFAAEAGLLPALGAAYDDPRVRKAPLIGAYKKALEHARTRPQHPVMSQIFDDFTAAVQAVLLGDAKPAEALAGVARAWRRLLERHRDPTSGRGR